MHDSTPEFPRDPMATDPLPALFSHHNHQPRATIRNLQIRLHGEKAEPGVDVHLSFDLQWDGAWRRAPDDAPGNWNALWVFVKFRGTKLHRYGQTSTGLDHIVELCAPDLKSIPGPERREMRAKIRRRVLDMIAEAREMHPDKKEVRLEIPRETHARAGHGRPPTDVDVSQDDTIKILIEPGKDENSIIYRDAAELKSWRTAKLSDDSRKHRAISGDGVDERFEIVPVPDGAGVFVQLAPGQEGFHERLRTRVEVFWDTPDDIAPPAIVEVHSLNMIYVPDGEFSLGEPGNPEDKAFARHACFHATRARKNSKNKPDWSYLVRSEAEIEVEGECAPADTAVDSDDGTKRTVSDRVSTTNDEADDGGKLTWPDGDDEPGYRCANIPEAFPKGHRGFYCMRDQVTQGEYATFLNTLSGDALTMRFPYDGQGNNRFTIFRAVKGSPLRKATRPERPCSYLAWSDGSAFLWWAGLRPMTELEYEKCCRGPEEAVTKEYAWGTSALDQGTVILGHEALHPIMTGNCNIDNAYASFSGGDGESGPVEGGCFSTTGTHVTDPAFTRHTSNRTLFTYLPDKTDVYDPKRPFVPAQENPYREQTGASYYHIMALSGNLWELVVSAGTDAGRSFTGAHGNGELTDLGKPDFGNGPAWPESYGARGGSWYTPKSRARVASRAMATGIPGYDYRSYDFGIRGVRTAPDRVRGSE